MTTLHADVLVLGGGLAATWAGFDIASQKLISST